MSEVSESDPTDRRIWRIVVAIPRGRVATYGQVADLAGLPRAARRVGAALRRLPDDAGVPWHRVVNAKGHISFPLDSRQYREQYARLVAEGVVFERGRIAFSRYRWRGELDVLLWGVPPEDLA